MWTLLERAEEVRTDRRGKRDVRQVPVYYRPTVRRHGASEGHTPDSRVATDQGSGYGQGDGPDEGRKEGVAMVAAEEVEKEVVAVAKTKAKKGCFECGLDHLV